MKSIVTKPFDGCLDGDLQVQKFPKGYVLSGDIAKVALDNEWAEEADDDSPLGLPGSESFEDAVATFDEEQLRKAVSEAGQVIEEQELALKGADEEISRLKESAKVADDEIAGLKESAKIAEGEIARLTDAAKVAADEIAELKAAANKAVSKKPAAAK